MQEILVWKWMNDNYSQVDLSLKEPGVTEGSLRWDVRRCIKKIMGIPSKSLFCHEAKRYQFLSEDRNTWQT